MNRIRQFLLLLGRPRAILYIFFIGLILRLGLTAYLGNRLLPLADQSVFLDLAENWASGRGLSISDELVGIPDRVSDSTRVMLMTRPERVRDEQLGALWGIIKPNTPTAFFEPFYPVFLGVLRSIFGPTSGTFVTRTEILPFGPKVWIARIFQSGFDASVILILYYLGITLFSPITGALAALLYCFYPYSLAFAGNLVTQNTYLFLQALMVYFLVRTLRRQSWSNYILLGLTAGLTLLTRISLITFIPFIVVCLYLPLRRQLKWKRLITALAIMVLAVAPWIIRNYAIFGDVLLLPTKGGRNLWEYNSQIFLPEKLEGEAYGADRVYQKFARRVYPDLKAKELLPFPDFTTENEVQRDQILNQRVLGFIKANPGVYLQLCGLRFYQLFRVVPTNLRGPLVTLAALITFGWILPASLIGIVLSLKRRWRERAVLYALVFYTVGTASLTASGIPHRVPTDPYFILFAAFFLAAVFRLSDSPKTEPH